MISGKRTGLFSDLAEIWKYRELFFFLVWRDVKVTYKQTALGILWAILKPVASMLVFTVIFGTMVGLSGKIGVSSEWYPIFVYTGILPWNYFSGGLTRASGSLVGSSHLITKVYFPRIIIPGAAALGGVVDFVFAFLVLGGLMVYFGLAPGFEIFALVPLLIMTYLAVTGVGFLFSAMNVRYRDAGFILGFVITIWFYVSPVVYPLGLFKNKFGGYETLLYLNPMTGIIEGFRWSILGSGNWEFPGIALAYSAGLVIVMFVIGQWYFRRVERTFADVI